MNKLGRIYLRISLTNPSHHGLVTTCHSYKLLILMNDKEQNIKSHEPESFQNRQVVCFQSV